MEARDQLRQHVARALDACTEAIVGQAVRLLPFADSESVGPAEGTRLAEPLLQLIAMATREGTLANHHNAIAEARRCVMGTPVSRAFDLVYLLERAALDELMADESIGASVQSWPMVTQVIRRASFDVLAVIAGDLGRGALVDRQTALYTRGVLLEALEKELQRAERLSRPFALSVFAVDRLADISATHGHGFTDRLLERLGIVIHSYFREQDWVSRSDNDEFTVLLPETHREHASLLAEDVRQTVQTRLAVRDHRSGEQVPVTVSVALLIVEHPDPTMRARALFQDAGQAIRRAKQAGGNRVEIVDAEPGDQGSTRRREQA